MMNNIKLISMVLLITLFVSCDDSDWKQSELDMVPIYAANDVAGIETRYAIEIYPGQDLLIEFEKVSVVSSLPMKNYEDMSDEGNYKMHYTVHRPAQTVDGRDTVDIRYYEIEGTKVDSSSVSKLYRITNTNDTILLGLSNMKMFETERLY